MMKSKKIMLLGPSYPYRGGIADTQNQLALSLKAMGHDVKLLTFRVQYPQWLFPGKTQYSKEKPPQELSTHRILHSYNPFNWKKVVLNINTEKPDCVIFRYWTPFLAPCWTFVANGLDHKITKIGLVDNWIPHETRPWDKFLTLQFAQKMNGMATLSEAVGHQISNDLSHMPLWSGFHPISNDFTKKIPKEEARRKLGWPQNKKIILFFGLIRKYKGLDLLVDAYGRIAKTHPDSILAIVGEAYENLEKYTRQIKKLNLEDRVICDFNYANNLKAALVFSAADIVAQTYKSATQSGVTPLAYHFQTPILVTDLPGLKAPILKDKTGEIVKDDPQEIALKLEHMLDPKANDQYILQLKKVHKNYRWDTFVSSLITFLDQL